MVLEAPASQPVRDNDGVPVDDFPWGDRFEILEPLGVGGFATVYRARETVDGQLVALKALHTTPDPDARLRLTREIQALQILDSDYIVPVLEADSEGRWYSMPIAAGHLESRGPKLDACERGEAALDVARALLAAHGARLIHRDVSPRNILWFPEERRWKLADFGLVRRFPGTTTQVVTDGPGAWTWLFAAPELEIDPHNVDHRCDIFSLGQVIGWLMSGRNPAPQTQFIMPDGPWRSLVGTMTQRTLAQRPADMKIVLDELRVVLDALRLANEAAWRMGSGGATQRRPRVDAVTMAVLRRLFTEGPQSNWSLNTFATNMGLTREGVRVGVHHALAQGLAETRMEVDERGDEFEVVALTPLGEANLVELLEESDLILARESSVPPPPPDDIPF
jgi:serine/threonine protein kinase